MSTKSKEIFDFLAQLEPTFPIALIQQNDGLESDLYEFLCSGGQLPSREEWRRWIAGSKDMPVYRSVSHLKTFVPEEPCSSRIATPYGMQILFPKPGVELVFPKDPGPELPAMHPFDHLFSEMGGLQTIQERQRLRQALASLLKEVEDSTK